jgi:hypothetical protein
MAQKANLTPVDKQESDRREAERLDLEKHARWEAGLIDLVSAIQQAPTAEHQRREGLKAYRSGRRTRRCSSRLVWTKPGQDLCGKSTRWLRGASFMLARRSAGGFCAHPTELPD